MSENSDMVKSDCHLHTLQLRGYCSHKGYLRLQEILNMARTLYNAALQERRDAYRYSQKQISYTHQQNQLTLLKQDLPEYLAVDNRIWGATLWRLDKSFRNFFRRVRKGETPGYPRFKTRSRYRTIEMVVTHPGMLKTGPNGRKAWLVVKGLPAIEMRPKRALPGSEGLQTFGITLRPTGVTVDLVYSREQAPAQAIGKPAVGLDLGINQRLTLSEISSSGKVIEPRVLDRAKEENLRRKKRLQARECWRNPVGNRNQCHRITSALVKTYSLIALIALEDLNLRNMTRSAKGTVEEPGSQVKQKAGLNRSLLEQSLGLLSSQLRYKAEWAGVQLIRGNPGYTSLTCSNCGIIAAAQPEEYRVFRCSACRLEINRDLKAAINVLKRGLKAQQGGNTPAAPDGAMTTARTTPTGSSCM